MPKDLHVGDIVKLKKKHPCGSDEWEILRVGMDIRIKCLKCGRMVLMPRAKFEKSIKKILKTVENPSGQ
ncbi:MULTISPECIES: DUF951 domain-containing protein [Caldanaerobacter]|uniref:DUF951 domain-containing protein n=1 Tax=Caldanaerobacter subterraneus TaxID=911092 RepID=A0A4V2S8K2_9THEO|nr:MULTISPECIES: DUF951 domain-containing protein [Caldanaerobacter]TCO64210.1 hypothetical protein EV203_11252 [Caldanaerobacter subterraneus]